MKRIAGLADTHLGNFVAFRGSETNRVSRRGRYTLGALENGLKTVDQLQCDLCVIAGDVFENSEPLPWTIHEAARIIRACETPVIVMDGNHDSYSQGDSALLALKAAGISVVINEVRRVGTDTCTIELVPFGCKPTTLPATMVFAHHGIFDHNDSPYMKKVQGAVDVRDVKEIYYQKQLMFYAAGDWHAFKRLSDGIYQIGTLCPSDMTDGAEGGFLVFDVQTQSVTRHIVPGPRFLRAEKASDIPRLLQKFPGCQLHVEVGEFDVPVPDHVHVRPAPVFRAKAERVAATRQAPVKSITVAAQRHVSERMPHIDPDTRREMLRRLPNYIKE